MSRDDSFMIESNPFKTIFNASVEAIIAVDKSGSIILSNPSSARLFGYSKQEFSELKVEDLIPEHLRKVHKGHRQNYYSDPHSRAMGKGLYLVGRKKDGSVFPIEVSLSQAWIEEKPITIAFIIDISQKKKLEEQNQMYLDVAGSVFIVINKDQNVSLINKAGTRLLGVPQEQVVGTNWFDNYISPDKRDQGRTLFIKLFEESILKGELEEHVLNAKGQEIIIYWHFVLIQNETGDPISFLGSGIDITGRKLAEKALLKSEEKLIVYATQLEKKVGERTKELDDAINTLKQTNDELAREVETRKKAEVETRRALAKEKELNELKSRFVSMASHEFRTPLSTILSSASLIEKYLTESDAHKRDKHTKRIKSNVGNLTNLLNDFLSLEKLEKGKVSANISTFNLSKLLRDVVEDMSTQTKSGQQMEVIIDKEIQEVSLDENMVKNILNNLISNAIKYSAENSPIKVESRLNETNQIILLITDSGMGIPENEHIHLFERFFRAGNASNIQGTGLGLYIVKKYVEELGGSITFTSVLEEGTSFEIVLPLNYDQDSVNRR